MNCDFKFSEVLIGILVRLGGYGDEMFDVVKVKIWEKIGMFEQMFKKRIVVFFRFAYIIEMDIMFNSRIRFLFSIVEQNRCKFFFQFVLIRYVNKQEFIELFEFCIIQIGCYLKQYRIIGGKKEIIILISDMLEVGVLYQ